MDNLEKPGYGIYTCPLCPFVCNYPDELISHAMEKHSVEISYNKPSPFSLEDLMKWDDI